MSLHTQKRRYIGAERTDEEISLVFLVPAMSCVRIGHSSDLVDIELTIRRSSLGGAAPQTPWLRVVETMEGHGVTVVFAGGGLVCSARSF